MVGIYRPLLRIRTILLVLIFSTVMTTVFAQGLKPPADPEGFAKIVSGEDFGWSGFMSDSILINPKLPNIIREVTFDSTRQYVSIAENLGDASFRLPIGMDVEHYKKLRLARERERQWRRSVIDAFKQQNERNAGSGIELNIPLKIKNKAFRRIFGGDRVGLRVSGNITFELAGRTESREGSAVSAFESRNRFSPKFKQTQQFRVEGRVGDKVTVSVDQNSEATFDFENTLKLQYKGDEDEIIQSIEAGNVNLALPATRYVSSSSNHQGLFGVKTQMQLGNLSFTGIASLERGENQTLSVSGSSSENVFRVDDYNYVKDRFFFVDSIYRDTFEEINVQRMLPTVDIGRRVLQLDVWKTVAGNISRDDTFDGVAVRDPAQYHDSFGLPTVAFPENEIPGEVEKGRFQRLVPEVDYVYDYERGYFQLKSNLNDSEILAVAYRYGPDNTSSQAVGMPYQAIDSLIAAGEDDPTVILRLVRPKFSSSDYIGLWDMTMRNVYNLQGANIPQEGFDLRVLYTVTGEDQDTDVNSGKTFNNLMGIDRLDDQGSVIEGGDNAVDLKQGWIFNLLDGYLVFPTRQPFDPLPNAPFLIPDDRRVDIYNLDNQTEERSRSKFQLEVTTASATSSFSLGFNVLEGSEKVKLNGRELVKDKDYIIDYFSGQLEITADEARRADAQVDIEYERGALFQLDKKTLLGGRLDYAFSERNFIGLTALFYSKSTLDQRVRLGQEPIRNFVWDINTSLTFNPNFLTTVMDKLPVVETSAESQLKIEAEYAQVNPNPNTFNEEQLGDNDGVAYIDDFEGSKRFTSLGIRREIWTRSSVPEVFSLLESPGLGYQAPPLTDPAGRETYIKTMDRNRMDFYWYNPFNQVPINSIWPDRDVNARSGTTTDILVFQWKNDGIAPLDSAWAGVMRSTATFSDQKQTKFIELWVRGNAGQVNIDIGRISEDQYVQGVFPDIDDPTQTIPSYNNLNTEDRNFNGLLDLDRGEDTGIDGVAGVDGQNVPNDAGDDDWAAPDQGAGVFDRYTQVNGTEGNSNAATARYPDTEDLDGDNGLNIFNDYFTYSFDLGRGQDDPFWADFTEADGEPTGWNLYRIPIREFNNKVGNPDTTFNQIQFARIWINNVEESAPGSEDYGFIEIATFDFVGNEWEEEGFAAREEDVPVLDESKFGITVLNTEENAEYTSPPGVEGIRDRITQVLSKEQSLALQINELPAGGRVEARKQLRETVNLLNYKRLKMFVHGDERLVDADSLIFFVRFGAVDNAYYEYRQPVYRGWDTDRNSIELDFNELAATKEFPRIDEFTQLQDTLRGQPLFSRRDPNAPEKEFIVVGNPGLHNIKYFTIGALNARDENDIRGFPTLTDVQIWVDEMRVTGVERESGTAMRFSADLSLADVATFRAEWELVDDDFRRAEQQYASTTGKDQTKQNQLYTANLKLHKFLPESWAMDIPISAKYSRNTNVPKYFYNSDQRTSYGFDNITERFKSFFGGGSIPDTLAEQVTISESRSIGGTLKRKDKAKDPWYLRLTLNQLVVDVDYSDKDAQSPTQLLDFSQTVSGRLSYKIPFGRPKGFQPFGWLGESKFLKFITGHKFYYLPSNASMNMTLNDTYREQQNRLAPDPTVTVNVKTSRRFALDYKLMDNLSFKFNRDYQSDPRLRSTAGTAESDSVAYTSDENIRAGDVVNDIFSKFSFGLDKQVNQRFSAAFSPKLWTWLKSGANYSSDFAYSLQNPAIDSRISSLNVNRSVNFDFKPSTLVRKIYTPKSQGNRRNVAPARGRRGRRSTNTDKKEEDKKEEDKAEEKKGRSIPNPLMLFWHSFDKIKTFRVDVRQQENYSATNVSEFPDWRYQFGLDREIPLEARLDSSFNKVLQPPSRKKTLSIDGRLQVDLVKNLTSNFNFNKQTTDNDVNANRTVLESNTVFFTGLNPGGTDEEGNDVEQTWWKFVPNWTLSLSGVEKLPLFKEFTKTASIEHSRTGKFSKSFRREPDGTEAVDSRSYSINYEPLIGLNFSTRWGVSGSVRSNRTVVVNYRTAGVSTQEQSGLNINASYSVTKGFRLPLPFLNKKTLKNEIQFGVSFQKTDSKDQSRAITETELEEKNVVNSWKLRPSISYRFSQKVNGTAFYEQSSSFTKLTGQVTYREFGINVNIAIR